MVHRSPASLLIDANKNRTPPEDARARIAERDARIAADTRTELQKLLGEPEPSRSALVRSGLLEANKPKSAAGMRIDLWRK
jgi:hypothetical protein